VDWALHSNSFFIERVAWLMYRVPETLSKESTWLLWGSSVEQRGFWDSCSPSFKALLNMGGGSDDDYQIESSTEVRLRKQTTR